MAGTSSALPRFRSAIIVSYSGSFLQQSHDSPSENIRLTLYPFQKRSIPSRSFQTLNGAHSNVETR